ncbi:uncharacterized protein V6R79_011761 [Siganus canaliculatus]
MFLRFRRLLRSRRTAASGLNSINTKMKNIYPHITGKTLGSHEKFLQKLKGAKIVKSPRDSDAIIVFCPIASRFETDIDSALSTLPESRPDDVILVAMHHTFDKNYSVPNGKVFDSVTLVVNCLFYESDGLYKCDCNDNAIKKVQQKLDLKKKSSDGCLCVVK